MSVTQQGTVESVRASLGLEHELLEQALWDLACALESGDATNVQRVWSSFESGLLAHLELEEREIFPRFESMHADELTALRAEHERIRRAVSHLGLRSDLHALPRHTLEWFLGMLEAHAEREDKDLHSWMDEAAPLETRGNLLWLLDRTVNLVLDSPSFSARHAE